MSDENASESDVEIKLSAARTRLIIDKPFLGALVLRLPLVKADPSWCRSTATDARKFYYNEQYIDALSLAQTQFVLAHEALHCALSHFARRQHRIKNRWDTACDYAINPLLLKDDLTPPPGILVEESYNGMSAEEIYPYIDENEDQEPHDQHIYDDEQDEESNSGDTGGAKGKKEKQGKSDKPETDPDDPSEPDESETGSGKQQPDQNETGNTQPDNKKDNELEKGPKQQPGDSDAGAEQPPPLSHNEREELSTQWQQRLAGAAQSAMQAGKLGGDMARLVDFMLQPQLPWRMLLARYVTSVARDDYNYSRPSTRRGDPAIFPRLRSAQINLSVALDISGSISDKEMSEFLSEINAIKGQMRAQVTLNACDSELVEGGPWIYEAWEDFTLPEKMKGGGGTSFNPIFKWVDTLDMAPDLLVYFTDAEGEFPKEVPMYPVIWLVKGKLPVPWGQRIQLN
ncbi:MAG: VWA-like domain-containing protein [Gammaproteobacteria bacterium]